MTTGVDELNASQRMLTRERAAREAAERLLEQKSHELYEVNQKLRATSATHQREAYYLQTILDVARDGIMTLTSDGFIEKANASAASIFKCKAESLVGRSVSDLVETTDSVRPNQQIDSSSNCAVACALRFKWLAFGTMVNVWKSSFPRVPGNSRIVKSSSGYCETLTLFRK